MEEQLELIEEAISWFKEYGKQNTDPNGLVSMSIQLVTSLFYLETIRADYNNQHETMVFKLVSSGHSVARAVNEANVKIPELYLLRRVMDAAYRNSDLMKGTIYNLRKEIGSN